MGESGKALVGGFIVIAIAATAALWFIPDIPQTPLLWAGRAGLPVLILIAGVVLIREVRRPDLAPDFLRQLIGKPFWRDGVCFSIGVIGVDRVAHLNIIFQNQYASPCQLRVNVKPPLKSLSLGKRLFPGVTLDLDCDGGVFGVARMPIAVPLKYQNRKIRFEVAAAARYPSGKGQRLRVRTGIRAAKASMSKAGEFVRNVGEVLLPLLALVGGGHLLHLQRRAGVKLALPVGVAEQIPDPIVPVVQILWRPGASAEPVPAMLREAMSST